MAWIQQRKRSDGGLSACVMGRLGGGRAAPRQRETFSAGNDAQDLARAEGFKQMVDAAGQRWPEGWVKGMGFVRPVVEKPVGPVVSIEEQHLPSPNAGIVDDPVPDGWREPKDRSVTPADD